MNRWFLISCLFAVFTLSGCLEAQHELFSSSPLPRGIARDPRMRGLGSVRVEIEYHTDGTIVAIVTSRSTGRRFKVRGTTETLETPEKHFGRWRETYNGERDIIELYPHDYHYIRVVQHP